MARERYAIADLTLDVDAVSVTRPGGGRVELPQLSFELLVALARRAPDVVSGDDLIAAVWSGLAVSDETLTQRVALLRRALGDDARSPRYVRAVRGRGYQLVAEAAVPATATAAVAVTATADVAGGAEVRQATVNAPRRRPRGAVLALTALLLLAGAAMLAVALSRRPAVPLPAARTADPVANGIPGVPELLQRAGSYLRQHQAWDNELAIELYERALRLEPENARALAGLSMARAQRATKFNRRDGESEQAMALARRALARDPQLGLAHHALAMALDSEGRVGPALAAYQRAAQLEPDPTPALASAAYLLQVQGHLADALQADLLASRPGVDPPIYLDVQIAQVLALLGYADAAEGWFERGLELRPDNVFAPSAYARARLSQGRLREADTIAARAVERGIRRPELAVIRGTVALMAGDEGKARGFFAEALRIDPGYTRALALMTLLDRRHSRDAALERRWHQLVQEIGDGRRAGDEWPDSAIDEALLDTGFGDFPAALRALDAAIARGYRDAEWLLLDPMLAALRADPGFAAHVARIRELVTAERERVAGAPWLPPSLLQGKG